MRFSFKKISLISFAIVLLSSCEGDQTVRFVFTGLDLQNMNTSSGLPEVVSTDSTPKNLYALRLNLFPIETYRKGRYFDEFESSVYNENRISKMYITSDRAFDAEHPVGTVLNKHFIYFPGNYLYCTTALDDTTGFDPYGDYLPTYPESNFPEYADLLLMKYPDTLAMRKFYVQLILKDGTVFLDSTASIKLY